MQQTLFDIINATKTPMGDRLLKRWMVMPLKQAELINGRLGAVASLVANAQLLFDVDNELSAIGDMERLVSKIAVGRISPKELRVLADILSHMEPLKKLGKQSESPLTPQFRMMRPLVARAADLVAAKTVMGISTSARSNLLL